ncbi:hypothetical protein K505DRAFT_365321 [Melanomma pulvis-pyrius CBS 109.77]|uniref:Uncharacterized protein n=1 Tax=Melanomma pulvis-pyrius CBS 109.77 TaxID=1314802 RepID=A0A6A6X1H4_9PLEO|nr:hypothetical protein K505DRAFT_365321 [Melanomma pulvis-pyrius CBS 109.77]
MKIAHVCACLLSLLLAVQSRRAPNSNPQQASVGRFSIKIHDERLPLEEAVANNTGLIPNLTELFVNVLIDYYLTYNDENTPPVEAQWDNITAIAQSDLFTEFFKYNEVLLNASKEVANSFFEQDKKLGYPNPDVTYYYLDAIANMTQQTYYYILGAYIGVGVNSACAKQINQVLADKDEWAKMGSGAASTLMALLPTFLAYGNLYVPRSSEAFTTSAFVGLTTAFYSFGLPTKSMSAVKSTNVHILSVFGITTLAFIARLGKVKYKGTEENGTAEYTDITRDELSSWSRSDGGDEVKAHFVNIKELTNEWNKRSHWWHVPALAISAAQIAIFTLAVYPLFQYLGVPQSVFGCRDSGKEFDWTGVYLGASAGVNTVFRYVRWEMSSHERVKIYSVSDSANLRLMQIISTTEEGETTALHLPPLLPPSVIALRNFYRRFLWWRSPSPASKNSPGFVALFNKVLKSLNRRLSYIFRGRNFFDVLYAGFFGDKGSARRWRPVYILIHLSTEARNPFITLLTGFIEAMLLLVLTFFFAAQWGGNLILTMTALILLLVFVTMGRALGLFYVWLSSQVWGLTVVNCDDVDELRGVLRIVCSMEGVLVCVNGATYFGGYRMDGRDGFEDFLDGYERGQYDEADGPNRKGYSAVNVSGS